jgi:DUF1009 family protein
MSDKNRLGIIAGEGKFPVLIVRAAKARGFGVYVVGIKGNAKEEDYKGFADKFIYLRVGAFGSGIEFFKKNDVRRALMAGRVQHTNIFSVIPDFRGAKLLAKTRDMRPKNILKAVIGEFRKEGVKFEPSNLFLEDFMPAKGVLTKRAPNAEEQKSVDLGFKVSKTLAALDVGLTCAVAKSAVVAVEGMEGTDNCVLRAGEICRSSKSARKSSLVIVKAARPAQDERYDLPVIGKGTIETMRKAGAGVLAFEARKTLVLDLPEVIKLANKLKFAIVSV